MFKDVHHSVALCSYISFVFTQKVDRFPISTGLAKTTEAIDDLHIMSGNNYLLVYFILTNESRRDKTCLRDLQPGPP